jgi:hypothetical protein
MNESAVYIYTTNETIIIVFEHPAASDDHLQLHRIIGRITTYSVVSREALT